MWAELYVLGEAMISVGMSSTISFSPSWPAPGFLVVVGLDSDSSGESSGSGLSALFGVSGEPRVFLQELSNELGGLPPSWNMALTFMLNHDGLQPFLT